MAEEKKEAFLQRWSRLKHEEKRELPAQDEKPLPPLPPVEKLTPESDFSGFMHPKVEDALRRAALKKLFRDPHFNIPDPYEPYSRDFNIADPIPPEMLATLKQAEQLIFSDRKEEEKPKDVASGEKEKREADEPGKQDA
jgi:Protein of unknown function (DUF3306)